MNTENRFETIYLTDRRVLVDKEAEINSKSNCYVLLPNNSISFVTPITQFIKGSNEIIASYPQLGNLPLLPEMDDEAVKFAAKEYPVTPFYDGDKLPYYDTNYDLRTGYAKGFKAAKELYPFSKEDMIGFANFIHKNYELSGDSGYWISKDYVDKHCAEELLQLYLDQKTKPQFIPEMEWCCGRCDGINDLCITDMICELHKKEFVLNQKPMKEKISIEKLKQDNEYVVYLDSIEEWEELNKLCGFEVVSKYYGRHCYSPCNWSYSPTSSSTNPGSYIYKGQSSKIITLKDIKEYNMVNEETQKIIGYECPIDLFQGDIKKGTLYKPTSSTKVVCYAAIGKVGVLGSKYNLPSEIVETWKPVYEDIISMGGYEVKFSKDKIKFDGTEFTKNQLETLEEVLSDNKNIQVTLKHIKADIELLRKLIKNCK